MDGDRSKQIDKPCTTSNSKMAAPQVPEANTFRAGVGSFRKLHPDGLSNQMCALMNCSEIFHDLCRSEKNLFTISVSSCRNGFSLTQTYHTGCLRTKIAFLTKRAFFSETINHGDTRNTSVHAAWKQLAIFSGGSTTAHEESKVDGRTSSTLRASDPLP